MRRWSPAGAGAAVHRPLGFVSNWIPSAVSIVAAPGRLLSAPAKRPDVPGAIRMLIRGVRGATTVEANTLEAILEATRELLARC